RSLLTSPRASASRSGGGRSGSFRLAPKQNARPAPVIIRQRAPLVSSRSKAHVISRRNLKPKAFRTLGSFSVIIATLSRISSNTRPLGAASVASFMSDCSRFTQPVDFVGGQAKPIAIDRVVMLAHAWADLGWRLVRTMKPQRRVRQYDRPVVIMIHHLQHAAAVHVRVVHRFLQIAHRRAGDLEFAGAGEDFGAAVGGCPTGH